MRQIIKRYDLVCLGGGPASVYAAIKAASLGKTACIVERDKLGGVCLNKGCIPKKIFFCAADVYKNAQRAAEYGLWTEKGMKGSNDISVNWGLLNRKCKEYAEFSSKSMVDLCTQRRVDVIQGMGKFIRPNALQVITGNPELVVEGEYILIATGGAPSMPSIKGIQHAINSDSLFNMEKLPESIIVVGGDYIGMETACYLNTFGVKTTVCMKERIILSEFDSDLTEEGMAYLTTRGITFHPLTVVEGVERVSDSLLSVKTKTSKDLQAEMVLMATGRSPSTRNLGLEEIGVKKGKRGEIVVDEYDATTVHHIFAIGDVAGKSNLASVAAMTSKLLVERLFGDGRHNKPAFRMSYDNIPTAAFCDPPLVRCGMTTPEAVSKYGRNYVKVQSYNGYQLSQALLSNKEPYHIKMVLAKEGAKEQVVGIHAIGRNVEEIIGGFSIAMKKGLTSEDLLRGIPIHPTASEEFMTMFNQYT